MSYEHDETNNPLNTPIEKTAEIQLLPKERVRRLTPIIENSKFDPVYKADQIKANVENYHKRKYPPQILDKEVSELLAELDFELNFDVDHLAKAIELGELFNENEEYVLFRFELYEHFVPPYPTTLYMQISEKYLGEMQQFNIEETLVWLQENAFRKLRYSGIKVQLCTHKVNTHWSPVKFESDCNLNVDDKEKFKHMAYGALTSALNTKDSQPVLVSVSLEDRLNIKRALEFFGALVES